MNPFINSKGNIINVSYSRATDNHFGNYHANFNLHEPIQPGDCQFFAGEFETTENVYEDEQHLIFRTNSTPTHKTALLSYVISIPKLRIFEPSTAPQEIIETQTSNLLIFTKLIYTNQKFDLEIKFLDNK